ncbi:hypothetical protein GQX73_g2357 [Xylaria multiplex]|uniref:Uncharacterized protein n=1 Tax=Xylaria multiplex TaxID=323545 RepID=A0A7C8ISJ6_9PEZI|nr:hypothetical protein GQX73_g2357 [Xylaria multiplex]
MVPSSTLLGPLLGAILGAFGSIVAAIIGAFVAARLNRPKALAEEHIGDTENQSFQLARLAIGHGCQWCTKRTPTIAERLAILEGIHETAIRPSPIYGLGIRRRREVRQDTRSWHDEQVERVVFTLTD